MPTPDRRIVRVLLLPALLACLSCAARPAEDPADAAAAFRAAELVGAMGDAELASQILLTGVEGAEALSPRSAALLARVPAGGAMLFKYNLGRGAAAARRLSSGIAEAVGGAVPPFVAADQEGGSVHRFGTDATRLPAAAAFGALARGRLPSAVQEAAYRSGRELRALGITLNLAPVAEIVDEKSKAFLGDRAYGSDPELAGRAAAAFVAGMRRAGVACVVKHFPGNAAADPHAERAVLDAGPEELERLLGSFAVALRTARPAAVMVSHAVVASVDPDRPATLSPAVIGGLLRKRLGFRGVAVSDDLRMKAISSFGLSPARAATLAVAAGIDLVMTWPSDAEALRDALVAAAASGELPRERLREAAARVVAAKVRYGLLDAAAPEASPAEADALLAALRKDTGDYLRSEGLR